MVASLNARDRTNRHDVQNSTLGSTSHYSPSIPPGRQEVELRRGDVTRVGALSRVHVASEVEVEVDGTREKWEPSKRITYVV